MEPPTSHPNLWSPRPGLNGGAWKYIQMLLYEVPS